MAKINVEGICQDPTGKVMDLDATLTEAEFNRMVMDLVQRTFKVCDEALQCARMTAQDLDAVILVGGPTRLPIIRNQREALLRQGRDGGHRPRRGGRHGRRASRPTPFRRAAASTTCST